MNTYGALRFNLVENGYAPTSATTPGSYGFRVADDPAAILCVPQSESDCGLADHNRRRVLALTVTVRDKAIRASLVAVIGKHVGNTPPGTVHRILGHANFATTMKLYGGLTAEALDKAAGALGDAFEPKVEVKRS